MVGAVIGVVGGVFLGNWLADKLKLKGWKRGVFVGGVSALVGATSGAIGYFIGPYVAKIAVKLGEYVAQLIRRGKIAFKNMSAKMKSSMKSLLKQTCCFVAGTLISTPSGEKKIELIAVGDSVYAANPETGEIGIKKVSKIFKKKTYILYHVKTSGEEIVTTEEHPFWIEGKGWIEAKDLCPGDKLCLQNKKTIEVAINKMISIIEPRLAVIEELVNRYQLHTKFCVVIELPEKPMISVSSEIIQIMARLSAEIEFDMYVLGEWG